MTAIRLLGTVVGLTLALASPAWAAADETDEIPFADCPPAVKKTFTAEAKGQTIATVGRESIDGKRTYWAGIAVAGRNYAIGVDEKGTLVEVSLDFEDEEVAFAACPPAVQKTFRDETKGGHVGTLNKGLKYGGPIYEATVAIAGKEYELVIGEDGTLVEKTLLLEEEEVAVSACPAAVQKTLREATHAAELHTVSKDPKYGGAVYGAMATVGGKDYEILVAEDGTLIEMTLLFKEDMIKFAACPAAVQQVLHDETQGARINEVTRTTGISGHVYEAEVRLHGRYYGLEVTDSGVLISKALNENN